MAAFSRAVAQQLIRGACAALLALGAATAHAQVQPRPAPPLKPMPKNIAYYVDGKPATQASMQAVGADNIKSIDVIKDAAQLKELGQPASEGAVLVTTKNGADSPVVQAFNKRFPLTPATAAQNTAVTAAQAYIAQHYPTAKVESVIAVPNKADRYNVTFTNNGQRVYLLFDGQGQPVEQ